MRRKFTALPFMFLCLVLLNAGMPRPAVAATPEEARHFVDSVGKRVLDVINGSKNNEAQKQQQLKRMFVEYVDIPWMAKFVLGSGWNQASDAQKKRYMDAYQQYLLARYTSKFSDYTGSKYTITDAKDEGDGQFIVSMQIKASGDQQQATDAGYRVRAEDNGSFKITDIIIEGVSLITTERADFGSVLKQKGLDTLIHDIEAKTNTEAGNSGQQEH